MIGRRKLITLLGGAAVAWPLAARGQEVAPGAARSVDRPARIAVISFISPTVAQPYWREFRNGLRALGWIEGRNVTIAERFAEGEDERLPAIVDDIVAMKPEVIVIDGARVVRAFRERTAAIPIVTSVVSDPVGSGFIASFARPGGNVTGMAFQDADLITKRAELLKELVPGLARVALLQDPGARSGAPDRVAAAAEQAVRALGLVPHMLEVRRTADLAPALDTARAHGDQAVLQVSSPFFSANREVLVAQAMRVQLPLSCEQSPFVAVGCLVSYGPNFGEMHRRAAFYVDRILKGEHPAGLPVEQPAKFDLVINLKTAKALGLDVPLHLQQLADEVIE
jgi:putative tryptophan/tyrosine transport system substrate-binding protein